MGTGVVEEFIARVQRVHATGQATEHSYRSALESLFSGIAEGVTALNEPSRVECGAPDLVVFWQGIEIGHCEAKDLGVDLTRLKDANLAQKQRYLKGLPNLIYTNGLDFEFYREGELIRQISIAQRAGQTITPQPEFYPDLLSQLAAFVEARPSTIGTAKRLAELMAGKAVLIKDIMGRALVKDLERKQLTDIVGQYEGFKAHLIHDTTPADFADIYAETIAYGLFAARLHDDSPNSFSRAEALDLLPKSNPFLRSLFGYIAGTQLDDRIKWIIDDLCAVFRAADLHAILKDFGKFTARNDPFLHFYETFLAEYNPTKRKARGVWYTPEPVVNFIVRAVDDILKTEFGLAQGLADTSKLLIDWDTGQTDNKGRPVTLKKEVHRVQVLDPATGTGTFLAEVIKLVADRVCHIAPSQWSAYVEADLVPRLHGFELLMASYAMCHMKLDMILTELGYKPSGMPPRLGVYLTNSLEEGEVVSQNLFAQWIANEAKHASDIKNQTPIMCIIGNPPYSGESANKGEWIMDKMAAYKMEPGGREKLKERNPKWINDDYVKFIRFAEHMIAKNGEGILGFITNHGYLDNPTFRGMRWHLLTSFDKIWVLDLHGNAKKKEVAPDGSTDKNVFDIMQGVAIIIGFRKKRRAGEEAKLADVWHGDLWGNRNAKYAALWEGDKQALIFAKAQAKKPHFLFVKRDSEVEVNYNSGFNVAEMFPLGVMGFQTHRDDFAIGWTQLDVFSRCNDLRNFEFLDEKLREKYDLHDNRDWQLVSARRVIQENPEWATSITPCHYRPLDNRFCHLSYVTMDYPRKELIQHGLGRTNLWMGIGRQGLAIGSTEWCLATVSDCAMDANVFRRGGVNASPLYLYPENGSLDQSIRVNFDPTLYAQIRAAAGLTGPQVPPDGSDIFRHATGDARPDEVQVFDYIYGVLHCPAYRATFAEFLKIDFPRVPYPPSPAIFRQVSEQGEALRRLHLMEPSAIGETPYVFDGEGDSIITQPRFADGRVWINASQFFAGVPEVAWGFHIGGYQPAQKWLKDRKGRVLTWDDVCHYQKIIKILCETDRIMQEIDMPLAPAQDVMAA